MRLDLLGLLRSALAGRYEVSEEVGRGGMAIVYRARDLQHARDVAIKVLYPDLARAVGGERFLREIGILSRLSHPNILPLLDSGGAELVAGLTVPWYAMPFVPDETLRARLTREGALPLDQALAITRELCAALGHAHAEGFIHRDIKPENILLRGDRAVLADFGIARALTAAAGGPLTSTGMVVGTPAYMSPEQAAGDERLDGRSDLYSLGCVLYEMLAGHTPFAGSTPRAIAARHQFEPPPPIAVVRPGLPGGVEEVLDRLLAKVPADRYQTAGDVAEALERAPATAVRVRATKRRRWPWRTAAVTALLVAAAWFVVPALVGKATLDPSRYVVLPFAVHSPRAATLVSGGNSQELVLDILGRIPDHYSVSPLTVGEQLNDSTQPLTRARALRLARSLGAGRLLWGEIDELADTVRVTGVLYDVATGLELQNHPIRLPLAGTTIRTLAERFAELTYALVLPGQPAPETAADVIHTKSFAAWKVYATGDSALNAWNLPLAAERYRAALTLDPEFPKANLRLAQVGQWQDDPVAAWRDAVLRAAAAGDQLNQGDQAMAAGLLALSDGNYPTACRQYRALLARDSLDFRGWYGLGECITRDDAVLPDSASPSGWRFRSSYAAGIAAYRRGLLLVPSTHLAFGGASLGRLELMLAVSPDKIRSGSVRDATRRGFQAYPRRGADTLAFVPYPSDGPRENLLPGPTWRDALAANLRTLVEITSAWLARYPGSRAALLTQARTLELAGRLGDPGDSTSALGIVRRLRTGPASGVDLPVVVDQARLLTKAGRYGAARALAESALAVPPTSAQEGQQLASLAALIGRADRAADLLGEYGDNRFASSKGELVVAAPEVARDANRLLVYAGFGEPAESLATIERRLTETIRRTVPANRRATTLDAVLLESGLLGFPALQHLPTGDWSFSDIERRLASGNREGVRDSLVAHQRARPPGVERAISPDFAVLEARLFLLAGDTAAASARLLMTLRSLPELSPAFMDQVTQAAAVGRAMLCLRRLGLSAQQPGNDSALTALWQFDPSAR